MKNYLSEFISYLKTEKELSKNSLIAYEKDIRNFEKYISKTEEINVLSLKKSIILDYLLYLKKSKISDATINRKSSVLNSFFLYLSNKKIIEKNSIPKIKSSKAKRKRIKFLSIPEMETLLNHQIKRSKRDIAILELFYASGITVTELANLKEEDLDFEFANSILVKPSSGKTRLIPIGKKAIKSIKEYVKTKKDNNVKNLILFLNNRKEKISRQYLTKMISNEAKKAGLKKEVTPQVIRDSFAIHMLQNGADMETIKRILGFKKSESLAVYLEAIPNFTKQVYDRCHPRA